MTKFTEEQKQAVIKLDGRFNIRKADIKKIPTSVAGHLDSIKRISGMTRDQFMQCRAELENKPSWDYAPDWAGYLICAGGKYWHWFTNTPVMSDNGEAIKADKDRNSNCVSRGHCFGAWRESLERRPQKESSKAEQEEMANELEGTELSRDEMLDYLANKVFDFMWPVSSLDQVVYLEKFGWEWVSHPDSSGFSLCAMHHEPKIDEITVHEFSLYLTSLKPQNIQRSMDTDDIEEMNTAMEWDGEKVPPLMLECLITSNYDGLEITGYIIAIHKDRVWIFCTDKKSKISHLSSGLSELKFSKIPVRTAEEIEREAKREDIFKTLDTLSAGELDLGKQQMNDIADWIIDMYDPINLPEEKS